MALLWKFRKIHLTGKNKIMQSFSEVRNVTESSKIMCEYDSSDDVNLGLLIVLTAPCHSYSNPADTEYYAATCCTLTARYDRTSGNPIEDSTMQAISTAIGVYRPHYHLVKNRLAWVKIKKENVIDHDTASADKMEELMSVPDFFLCSDAAVCFDNRVPCFVYNISHTSPPVHILIRTCDEITRGYCCISPPRFF